jgi:hypothetical protein
LIRFRLFQVPAASLRRVVETLNTVANVLAALALIAGLVYGAFEAGRIHRRRRDALALEAVRIMYNEATVRAVQAVLELPDDATPEQLRLRGPEAERAVRQVEHAFDTLGWMVHRRMIGLHDLDDLMGGAVRAVWRRVRRLARERREAEGPADFEWTQWLAERLEENPSPAKQTGANVHYRAWQP